MSQVPPTPGYPNPAGYPPMPAAYPAPAPQGSSAWKWLVGIVGLMILMPCMCCTGCLAYSFTIKDLTISNGEHLGGPSPMNIKFDYAFRDDGSRGPLKAYYIVVQAANGTRRETAIHGQIGFGMGGGRSVPMTGTWHFGNAADLGPENNKRYVKVWIESEAGGGRSTASNTLTIYPKS